MTLLLYNTFSKSKEVFKPIDPNFVTMYNCGPTVYKEPHIGNFRAFIFADILRRYLEYLGFTVKQVMNITDVGHILHDADFGEDRLEKAAKLEKKSPWEIATHYTNIFFELIDKLKIKRASVYPKATEHIPEMIDLIKKIIDKGYAYEINGCVYFKVMKFKNYGKLSGNTLDELQAGARIEIHPDKRNPLDFALWKYEPKHIMQWDSPWSRGFPGWHIECSAMSMKYLGEQIDIHTGGEDNIFPHHECEIAQSEAATGKKFVNYWLHCRHLLIDNEKMSKSLGNFFTVNDLLSKGFSPETIRYALSCVHYRQPLNFTPESLESAKGAVERLNDFKRNLTASSPHYSKELQQILEHTKAKFESAMNDDLNTSEALAAVFEMIRQINKIQISTSDVAIVLNFIEKFNSIFDILIDASGELSPELLDLIKKRDEARAKKDFALADSIREELKKKGIILEDTKQGTRWKRIIS